MDKNDHSGLQYVCQTCGLVFKITFDDLYENFFSGGHVSSQALDPGEPEIAEEPANIIKPVHAVEPSWLLEDKLWLDFKRACFVAGIVDPWQIIARDGQLDLASFFLSATSTGCTDFIKVLQDNVPLEMLERVGKLAESSLKREKKEHLARA